MFIIALFSLATHDEEETTISPLPIVSLRSLSLSLFRGSAIYLAGVGGPRGFDS